MSRTLAARRGFSYGLGERVVDKVTKTEGVVTGRMECLTEGNSYRVLELSQGRVLGEAWFLEFRLERKPFKGSAQKLGEG